MSVPGRRGHPAARVVFLTVMFAFIGLPLAMVVLESFAGSAVTPWPPHAPSLTWYESAFAYGPFWSGLVLSAEIATAATLLSLVLGTMAAYGIARHQFPGRRLLQTLFIVPLSVPRIVIGFSLFVIYVTLVPDFYGSDTSVVLAHCLLLLPFSVTIVGATLANLGPTAEEAARDLGCTRLGAFWKVTMPRLRIALTAAAVFAFITSFDDVDTTIFLLAPQRSTLPLQMFFYVEQSDSPTVAALSTLLIAGSLIIVVIAALLLRRGGLPAAVLAQPAVAPRPLVADAVSQAGE
jgi:putative spermidine/putrescine transport system permease protein